MHTLDQLAAFVAVFECGSYSAAGRYLAKDRTTVRELVKAYEDILGYKLFTIEGRQAIATEEANRLYSPATHVIRQNSLLQQLSVAQLEQPFAELIFGYDGDFPRQFMCDLDRRISEHYPHIRTHWLQRDREVALNSVEDGSLNFAISPAKMNIQPQQKVLYKSLGYVSYNLYVGSQSPLRNKADFSLLDAQAETQLIAEHTNNAGTVVHAYSVDTKVVGCNALLLDLLPQFGWAILPKHVAESSVKLGRICQLKSSALANDVQMPFSIYYPFSGDSNELSQHILGWCEELAQRYFSD
ncbi:transcriptional regulator, LysR family protein [Vibrio orientalis CIP 102891 = ATCC 33934]|uniref:Transcriptional regulator, LysR family protein n=1 Tax=Vibrio orientalis CIP 102891 = ATCC 33934 TaxID=675816 RepID=C9QEZ6_VIBOR|nr:LysR family transcriptional regulator [Vibrio orientalis]EEX94706.1 transcriptional regulators LysR family [Vibrio orientalis CIP 102891 = ATCC 33934]EGU51405.1 transcriptional regulator, LysR family protein [Vibrio orientalis CIP 102891 = ATCC 33934]